MKTSTEIANRYVSLCKEGQFDKCLDELYAKDALSVEAWSPTGQELAAKGLEAIRSKGAQWYQNHEIHRVEVSGPYPNGDRFAVRFVFEVTNKPANRRMTMDEVGLFTVEDGKITREEFFYQGG